MLPDVNVVSMIKIRPIEHPICSSILELECLRQGPQMIRTGVKIVQLIMGRVIGKLKWSCLFNLKHICFRNFTNNFTFYIRNQQKEVVLIIFTATTWCYQYAIKWQICFHNQTHGMFARGNSITTQNVTNTLVNFIVEKFKRIITNKYFNYLPNTARLKYKIHVSIFW